MYVYKSESSNATANGKVYAVGYWNGDTFLVASRHNVLADALKRVNYLNGGNGANPPAQNASRE